MDDQERLARAVEEVLKAHRESRVTLTIDLALDILASTPSAPLLRGSQFGYGGARTAHDDRADGELAILIRREHRRRVVIFFALGITIAIALLSPLGLLFVH